MIDREHKWRTLLLATKKSPNTVFILVRISYQIIRLLAKLTWLEFGLQLQIDGAKISIGNNTHKMCLKPKHVSCAKILNDFWFAENFLCFKDIQITNTGNSNIDEVFPLEFRQKNSVKVPDWSVPIFEWKIYQTVLELSINLFFVCGLDTLKRTLLSWFCTFTF